MMQNRDMNIAVLTGAGVSAASGLSTFRDTGGLWEQYRVEDVATPEAWLRNPERVTEFYNKRREQLEHAAPNAAHRALVELESKAAVHIITQNVDDLHQRAGSARVLHLHGELTWVRCCGPEQVRRYWGTRPVDLLSQGCANGHPWRPDVVWFGEEVPRMDEAYPLVETADLLLVVGTSLQVYPAAQLAYAALGRIPVHVFDPAPLSISGRNLVEHHRGPADELLPCWVETFVP